LVNATEFRSWCAALLLGTVVLTAAAWLRSAEYDEQYTLFLTAGTVRPDWPETVFPAGVVAAIQAGHATLAGIARDLRTTDVHPPLYFWAMSLWRDALGPSLFAARMMSVVCGVVSLGLVGVIARRCGIGAVVAMLLTLGCYGFVYTNAIARGFALAEMLTLCGVALLLGQRSLLAGVCFGAACCCNYLAVFVGVAVVAAAGAWLAAAVAIPFLALDAWFFIAQHAARTEQFPPFAMGASLLRLAEYQTASVFGGLPLYFDGLGQVAVKSAVALVAGALAVLITRARPWNAGRAIRVLLAAAVAPPVGLLLLGEVFDNTPIELRYLSFGLPFVALLVASSMLSRGVARCRRQHLLLAVVVSLQLASIFGLLLSPRTMQPARATAAEAVRLVGDGIVLVPRGNDGVGIVGAFAIEAPPVLPILLVRPFDRIVPVRRVALALLAQDRESIATVAAMRAIFAGPNWHRVASGYNVEVYERSDERE
jgi:hypothetical protein